MPVVGAWHAVIIRRFKRFFLARVPWVSGVVILAHIFLVPLLYAWGALLLWNWQPFPWDEFFAFFPPSGEYPLPRHEGAIHFAFTFTEAAPQTAPIECSLMRLGLMFRNELEPTLGLILGFAMLGITRYRLTRRWVDCIHWLFVIAYFVFYLAVTLAVWHNLSGWTGHPA
jgi:hypothetical protein